MDRPPGIVDFTPVPSLYPFTSRWYDAPGVGPVHYVDEGRGRPILMLHGNPDWSFIYRRIIRALRDSFRCVALDLPGFGLSAHPSDYGYTPREHAEVVAELVEHLDLTDAIVMGGDWGGPIGMDVASRVPERFSGIAMGNTWFWPADGFRMRAFSRVMATAPAQRLILERNAFVRQLMARTLQASLTGLEFAHYLDVARTPESRRAMARVPKEILASQEWLGSLEERVEANLTGKRTLLLFGRKDFALGTRKVSDRWLRTCPEARLVELPRAGHFWQEDAPADVVRAVREAFG